MLNRAPNGLPKIPVHYLEESDHFPQFHLSWPYGKQWSRLFDVWTNLMSSWWVIYKANGSFYLFWVFDL